MATGVTSTPFKAAGKSAIITGGGSGIGFEFTKLLLSKGCNVLIADLTLRPESQRLVEEYSETDGIKPRAVFAKVNVTIWNDLTRMFDVAEQEFGGFDIVCPGAGVFEPNWSNFWRPPGTAESRDPLHGSPETGIGHYGTLDLNIIHPVRTSQIAISRWMNPPASSKGGKASPTNPKRLIHISSVAGQVTNLNTPLYHVSKFAVTGLIRSLAKMETFGIRVNGVAPGLIRTPLWLDHPEKMLMVDEANDAWVEPSEVAEQMLRCCEDDEIGPGVVWEVCKDSTRAVLQIGDKGPDPVTLKISNIQAMEQDTLALIAKPGWGVSEK